MSRLPWILFVSAALVGPNQSDAQSISLEAKAISTGGRVRSMSGATLTKQQDYANNRTVIAQDFWSSRDRESKVGLEIGVRNFGSKSQSVEVLSLFFAKTVTGKQTFLISAEQEPMTLRGGESAKTEAYSASAKNRSERSFFQGTNPDPHGKPPFVWSASGNSAGAKIAGWIVHVVADGRTLQTRTSGPAMDALARDSALMETLMRPMKQSQMRGQPPTRLP